jgi:hypothetical protein
MFVLLPAAHAYTIVCNGFDATATVPASGAVDVPVDVRLAITFADGCQTRTPISAELIGPDGAVIATTIGEGSDDVAATHLFELFPDEDLAADSDYLFRFTSDSGEMTTVPFRTGSGRVTPLEGTPTLLDTTIAWSKPTSTVSLTVEVVPDPTGLSILEVTDDLHGANTFPAPTDGQTTVTFPWADSVRPAELCPTVRQVDGAGVATEFTAADCAPVPLCATSPAAGLLAAVAAALAAFTRRK